MNGLIESVRRAWSSETSADPATWTVDNPASGQCAVTSLVVQDAFGGELLRSTVGGVSHYWNRLPDGTELDLTLEQFGGVRPDEPGEVRARDYVLSFTETARRYALLRKRMGL